MGRMSRRSTSAGTSPLKAAQNQVRGNPNTRLAVSRTRGLVPAAEMQIFVDWLPTVRHKGRGITFDHFPSSTSELWRRGTLARTTLAREIAWAVALFIQHAERLSDFRVAASRYESLLVQDQYKECAEQLDLIEREFGISLWAIETRMALHQRAEGLEAQKAYAARVQGTRGQHDVISFLCHHLSRRNEPSTTPLRYVMALEDVVSAWDDPEGLGPYVLHRLGHQAPTSAARHADVLRHEASAALVDHYDTFVRLSATAAVSGDETTHALYREAAVRLAGQIGDRRLARTAFLLSGDVAWLAGISPVGGAAEDALILGDFERAAALTSADMAAEPRDARAWCTAANVPADQAVAGKNEIENLRGVTVSRMRSMIERSDASDAAVVDLLRDALNHALHDFSNVVRAVVWSEMFVTPASAARIEAHAFAFGWGLRPSDVGRVGAIGPSLACSVAARCVSTGERSVALADQLLRAGIQEDAWQGMAASDPDELSEDALLEAKMISAFGSGDHDLVLRLAGELPSVGSVPRRRRVSRLTALSLNETGRIADLAGMIARTCVTDSAIAGMLPLAECAKSLDKGLRRDKAGDISIPIVLDLFSKRFDDSLDDVRSFAYEDLLLAHGVERPSQLDGREEEFDRALLVQYLRHICVPEVMQVSSAFQGTRELEDERKKVLSLLVQLDPDKAKDYEAELREVTRAQLIHRGVRQVERSKIYVDVPAIRRSFEKKHRETLQRYQALSRAGIGTDDGELEYALEQALTGTPLPRELLEVPKNEANDLLLQMLRWLFEECSTSPEHGLDCYLSMRIRHGTLSGQLRTPLEVERVITQRASDTDDYEPNGYWTERLEHLPEEARQAVDARLARFSADYDEFIDRIAQEMVQIRRPDRPAGLFYISLRSVRFRIWVAELRPDMTFDDFFERAMEVFWESVEQSLSEVRTTIDGVLKPETNAMFAGLERDVGELSGGAATADLDRAVRTARTGTLQALDHVKDWFRLSQPISEPPFPIGDLIDVGLQCVKAIHREFAPRVTRDLDPLPPFAHALVLFSDIFFILFDNVRRHSGAGPCPMVAIEIRDSGDTLRIAARSEVASSARTPETIERIELIKKAIADGDYGSAVRSEGGTGLIKLRRLVDRNSGEKGRLDFGFEGHEFVVELELGKREIQT